jgi:hypothetical protein
MLDPSLPAIPVIDLGRSSLDELARRRPEALARLSRLGRLFVTPPVQTVMEWRSKAWLARNCSPYRNEIEAVAALPGAIGVRALNLSTEWACSTVLNQSRLIRVLDWPMRGLGVDLTLTRHEADAGAWFQATWPGFVGVLTGMAPGRFAAAFNQPPIRKTTHIWPLDWLLERWRVGRQRDLPPTHLLRQVFEEAPDFEAALARLRDTPIAMPAIYTLSGADGQAAIIERLERRARVTRGPTAIANHWPATSEMGERLGGGGDRPPDPWPKGWGRGVDSPGRFAQAMGLAPGLTGAPRDFTWLKYPILNHLSRLAAIMDAGRGIFGLVGLEPAGDIARPVTQELWLEGLKPRG